MTLKRERERERKKERERERKREREREFFYKSCTRSQISADYLDIKAIVLNRK